MQSGIILPPLIKQKIQGIDRGGSAGLVALLDKKYRRRPLLFGCCALFLIGQAFLLSSCTPKENSTGYNGAAIVGAAGRQPGLFSKPRAVAVTKSDEIVVIDRTGRVQFYDLKTRDFIRQWRLPKYDNGTPTGMCVDPEDDTLWLADTHNSRIMNYTVEGELLNMWGEYGEEPGKMIYPTDVAVDPDGKTMWVTEYGKRNRIIHFTRQGEFLEQFSTDAYDNIDLERPMAISISPDGTSLIVVDNGNCRINIYNRQGNITNQFGIVGKQFGQLKYPIDLALNDDNTMYIVEYENCRVSRYTLNGEFLDAWGEPGNNTGQLNYPWGCAVAQNGTLVIADTKNGRLQVIEQPDQFFLREKPHREEVQALADAGTKN